MSKAVIALGGSLEEDFQALSAEVGRLTARVARLEGRVPADVGHDQGREAEEQAAGKGDVGGASAVAVAVESEPPAAAEVSAAGTVVDESPKAHEARLADMRDMLREDGYACKASVWDSCLLIGHGDLCGTGGSFMLGLALLMNIVALSIFLVVLLDSPNNFVNGGSLNPNDMLRFRESTAHHFLRANQVAKTSLASAICAKDQSLHVGATQMDILGSIEGYTDPFVGSLTTGVALCVLTICIWLLNIGPEIQDIVTFFSAVRLIPRGRCTAIEVLGGESLVIRQLSMARFVFATTVSLLRLVSSCLILWFGASWLANTRSLENLVLNASALTCMKIDELLFNMLAPRPVQQVVARLQPLRRPARRECQGVGPRVVAAVALGIAVVAALLWGTVLPNQDDMTAVRDHLCGGDVNFVVGTEATGSWTWTRTEPASSDPNRDESYGRGIVRQLIRRNTSEDAPGLRALGALPARTEFSLAAFEMRIASPLSREESMALCEDTHPSSSLFHREYLMQSLGLDKSAKAVCTDLRKHCHDSTATLLRMLCPVTCGCHRPVGGPVITEGCPRSCKHEEGYLAELANLTCDADSSSQDLAESQDWRATQQGYPFAFPEVVEGDPRLGLSSTVAAGEVFAFMLAFGCDLVGSLPALFCSDGGHFASMAPFCPLACDCHRLHMEACPPSCDAARARSLP